MMYTPGDHTCRVTHMQIAAQMHMQYMQVVNPPKGHRSRMVLNTLNGPCVLVRTNAR